MLMTQTEVLDMLFEPVVLLLRCYARQMHSVITAVLRSSVPVRLRREANDLNRRAFQSHPVRASLKQHVEFAGIKHEYIHV